MVCEHFEEMGNAASGSRMRLYKKTGIGEFPHPNPGKNRCVALVTVLIWNRTSHQANGSIVINTVRIAVQIRISRYCLLLVIPSTFAKR